MAVNVRGVVRDRAEGKGVIVEVPGLFKQSLEEVSAPNVMCQVAEKRFPEGVVA